MRRIGFSSKRTGEDAGSPGARTATAHTRRALLLV